MDNPAGKKAQGRNMSILLRDFIERLHAQAYAGQLFSIFHFFPDKARQTVAIQMLHSILHGTNTRQDEGFGTSDNFRISCHFHRKAGPFRRPDHIGQIACVVIDNGCFHQSTPLVDNTLPPSTVTASFSAWPSPLKRDSTI